MTGRAPSLVVLVARVYLALWAVTLLAAGLSGTAPLHMLAEQHLAGRLQLYPHATPAVTDVLGLLAHNVRAAGWPLLFVALGLQRQRWQRQLTRTLLLAFLTVNASLVGAAYAVAGDRLLPFLPHLPFEWLAMAIAAGGWQRSTTAPGLPPRALAPLACAFTGLLAIAAALETYAVPHL